MTRTNYEILFKNLLLTFYNDPFRTAVLLNLLQDVFSRIKLPRVRCIGKCRRLLIYNRFSDIMVVDFLDCKFSLTCNGPTANFSNVGGTNKTLKLTGFPMHGSNNSKPQNPRPTLKYTKP